MSSPPQGRALALPFIRAGTAKNSVTIAEQVEIKGQSDEDAMARLQVQDSNALNLLFDRYARLVLSIALRILRDYGEAEEVVQDVFFYVYRKSALFEPARGSAKAWIVQIAFHRALDRKAHLSRRGFYLGTDIDPLHDTLLVLFFFKQKTAYEMNRLHLERAFEELPE